MLLPHCCPAKINGAGQDWNAIGCRHTTLSGTVSWTGVGPIVSGSSHHRYRSPGYFQEHSLHRTYRAATATGTVGGISLGTTEPDYASMGITKSGSVTICIGNDCWED